MRDFDAALERVVAGMQSRRVLTDHEKRVVAYHEAGHALCGELLPSVDRVHRISIVPRGRALGYTLNLPEEDRYLKTREELIDFMTMLLGRPRRRAARVRLGHHRRLGRPQARGARSPTRWSTSTRWAPGHARCASSGEDAAESTRRDPRRGGPRAGRRGAPRRDRDHRRPPRPARRARPTLLANEVLERDDIDRIMGGVPAAAPPRVRAAEQLGARRGDGRAARARRPQVPPGSRAGYTPRRCCPRSTTSGSPSRTSTRRSRCTRRARDAARPPRDGDEQGVDAVLLDVGDGHVELLAAARPRHAGGQVPGQQAARACTTSPTGWPTSRRRSARSATRACG